MTSEMDKFRCFSSITLADPIISGKTVKTTVTLKELTGQKHTFSLMFSYETPINRKHLPILRLAFCMPLLNYGLFSEKFVLQFPISDADIRLLNDLNVVFSRDIFINKIVKRRTNFILSEFIPNEKKFRVADANPKAIIEPQKVTSDIVLADYSNPNACGVLSSGGKDSLLTHGLLKELGDDVHPLYVNESGGHWRTALTAYKYHQKTEPNTYRVWTNVDRFYTFMLDHLKFIRSDHRKVRADTYAIRLCIFPVYIFALLPIFVDRKISNLLMGSEFDDLRYPSMYRGVPHYYGVYDQDQSFDIRMFSWYEKRIPGMTQWSALRNITGLVDQRILVRRYPHLAQLQRSCHSCHIKKGDIIPCGICSKCLGILLFLFANNVDPRIMNYQEKDIAAFSQNVTKQSLRLDEDEKNQSFFLIHNEGKFPEIKPVNHVEQIHIYPPTCDVKLIPQQFREGLFNIFEQYTKGYCQLKNNTWVPMDKNEVKSYLNSLIIRSASLEPS